LCYSSLVVLTGSLLSGISKVWSGLYGGTPVELSQSTHTHSGYASSSHNHDSVYSKLGHTHTASDISGLSNIATGSFTTSAASNYTINTQFTPNIAIWFSTGDLYLASRYHSNNYIHFLLRHKSAPTCYILSSEIFGSNYVKFSVETSGTHAYIIFG